MRTEFWWVNLLETVHLDDLGVDGMMALKLMLGNLVATIGGR
jgi:hypothetical protein